jgi:hypothetical protein
MFKSGTAKVKVMVVGDNKTVIISRPESIIEKSTELIGSPIEEDKITVITSPILAKKYIPKPKKKKSNAKKPTQLGAKREKN